MKKCCNQGLLSRASYARAVQQALLLSLVTSSARHDWLPRENNNEAGAGYSTVLYCTDNGFIPGWLAGSVR